MHLENSFSASSSAFSQPEDSITMSPTQLLSLAIKKRRSLYDSKDYDFRRVLGNTAMISTLCKYLGEGRAKRRRNRRSKRRHSSSKSRWADRTMSESEDEPECMDDSKLVIAPIRGSDQEGVAELADSFHLASDQTAQIVPSQNEQSIQTYACDDEPTMDQTEVEPNRKKRKLEDHHPVSFGNSLDEFFSRLAASPTDPYEFSASENKFNEAQNDLNQSDNYKSGHQLALCSY